MLPNCDDSPSKDAYLARGWAKRQVSREALHDLFFNPGEGRNVIDEPEYAEVAADLRARLDAWMAARAIRCSTARFPLRRGR